MVHKRNGENKAKCLSWDTYKTIWLFSPKARKVFLTTTSLWLTHQSYWIFIKNLSKFSKSLVDKSSLWNLFKIQILASHRFLLRNLNGMNRKLESPDTGLWIYENMIFIEMTFLINREMIDYSINSTRTIRFPYG